MRRTLLALTLLCTVAVAANAVPPTTVILVRHAEKAPGAPKMNDDPPLTAEGEARAQRLAAMLAKSGITAVYTTPFARTRNTAAPVAAALKLTPIEVKSGATYIPEMVSTLRALPAGSTALVVGHSNSTPALMKALGVANPPVIDDATEFDNVFVVTLVGEEAKMVVLKY